MRQSERLELDSIIQELRMARFDAIQGNRRHIVGKQLLSVEDRLHTMLVGDDRDTRVKIQDQFAKATSWKRELKRNTQPNKR